MYQDPTVNAITDALGLVGALAGLIATAALLTAVGLGYLLKWCVPPLARWGMRAYRGWAARRKAARGLQGAIGHKTSSPC